MATKSEYQTAHTLMIQGTTSDAGKSVMVAALGRILARQHIKVAPFKPQNMALNSAVTPDGGEIGRAQAVQAVACQIPCSVLMNPVLLKPNSDTGAQVIVKGRAVGNLVAKDYHHKKPSLLNTVVECFHELQQQYPVILVEGAGSPAEINLRDRDIANMGFAEAVDCKVAIIADIDRGGVFAHLVGTLELLSQSEQDRVVGFIINRFRGDISLLQSGLDWLEQRTGKPVLAVIPYIHDLHIEAEDAIDRSNTANEGALNVVVIGYPHASNHTDFDALRLHPSINCRFVRQVSELGQADLIILPGSKNTLSDLTWLKAQGWQAAINKHLRYGGKVMGICGGFQMLGDWVFDPECSESQLSECAGLSLLAMQTTLSHNKVLRNVVGHCISRPEWQLQGYEIHTGVSTGEALKTPLVTLVHEQAEFHDGAMNDDATVCGSYVHGLFDHPDMIEFLQQWLGQSEVRQFDYLAHRDAEMERLADVVETAWPVESIKKLLAL